MKIVLLEDNPILEDKVTRLINEHAKKGFAVISACRHDNTREENLAQTEKLKKDLKDLGWTYTVSYGGGFKEKGETFDTTKPKFNEISFVVYNHNRKFNDRNLLKDSIMLCGKFNQDDIYYQEPNGKAYWYDRSGNKDAAFSHMVKNDDGQMYFTGFTSSKLSKKQKSRFLKTGKVGSEKALSHRFSGVMEGVNAPPATFAEETIRRNNGEIFVSTFNVLTEEESYKILNNNLFNY